MIRPVFAAKVFMTCAFLAALQCALLAGDISKTVLFRPGLVPDLLAGITPRLKMPAALSMNKDGQGPWDIWWVHGLRFPASPTY